MKTENKLDYNNFKSKYYNITAAQQAELNRVTDWNNKAYNYFFDFFGHDEFSVFSKDAAETVLKKFKKENKKPLKKFLKEFNPGESLFLTTKKSKVLNDLKQIKKINLDDLIKIAEIKSAEIDENKNPLDSEIFNKNGRFTEILKIMENSLKYQINNLIKLYKDKLSINSIEDTAEYSILKDKLTTYQGLIGDEDDYATIKNDYLNSLYYLENNYISEKDEYKKIIYKNRSEIFGYAIMLMESEEINNYLENL